MVRSCGKSSRIKWKDPRNIEMSWMTGTVTMRVIKMASPFAGLFLVINFVVHRYSRCQEAVVVRVVPDVDGSQGDAVRAAPAKPRGTKAKEAEGA
jgi:hypothetical protein